MRIGIIASKEVSPQAAAALEYLIDRLTPTTAFETVGADELILGLMDRDHHAAIRAWDLVPWDGAAELLTDPLRRHRHDWSEQVARNRTSTRGNADWINTREGKIASLDVLADVLIRDADALFILPGDPRSNALLFAAIAANSAASDPLPIIVAHEEPWPEIAIRPLMEQPDRPPYRLVRIEHVGQRLARHIELGFVVGHTVSAETLNRQSIDDALSWLTERLAAPATP